MAWCTRETNFHFGYGKNPHLAKMSLTALRKDLKQWNPKGEGFEVTQGALAYAVARNFGVNLLPPECYDPYPLVRGSGIKQLHECKTRKDVEKLVTYLQDALQHQQKQRDFCIAKYGAPGCWPGDMARTKDHLARVEAALKEWE